MAFLHDMSIVGEVLLKVCSCQRINYDILGNTKQFLHAHIFQRYQLEESVKILKPIGLYDSSYWTNAKYQYRSRKA